MANITNHERSGVYSVYEASSVISGTEAGAVVGLAARCTSKSGDNVLMLYHYEQALEEFGADVGVLRLIELLLLNGASGVLLAPVDVDEDYTAALALLGEREEPKLLVCDSAEVRVHVALKAAVETASAMRRERIAVVCGGSKETSAQLIARAAELNSERMILVAPEAVGEVNLPGPCLAAAVAGAIAGESDPAVPLGGAVLRGLSDVTQSYYADETLDALIRGGVTVVERTGGDLCVVRGITTRTKTGGALDQTWRELESIRIVDTVIPAIRTALRARFARSKNSEQVRNAIRSQVILELENKLRQEIIAGYGEVGVSVLPEKPSVCLVEFSFTVTHGLNQIWLSAKITV